MHLNLPYLMRVRDKPGAPWRWYVRRGKLRVRGQPGDPGFLAEYNSALGNYTEPRESAIHTFRWLCERYMTSPEWAGLAASTRAQRRRVMQAGALLKGGL
jgi:hypothetical protein